MRLLLWLILAYVVWKIIQIVTRTMGTSRSRGDVFGDQPPEKDQPKKYSNIEDADFEDLPPEGKK